MRDCARDIERPYVANMAVEDKFTIKDLRPGMKNVSCCFIVIDRGSTNQTKDGSIVRRCRVGDHTGSVSFSLWNKQAESVEEGDILRLVRGYASLWKGSMVLYSGKYGSLEKIGEFTMLFSEEPDMSDPNHDFIQQYLRSQQAHGSSPRNGRRLTENHSNSVSGVGMSTLPRGDASSSHGRLKPAHTPQDYSLPSASQSASGLRISHHEDHRATEARHDLKSSHSKHDERFHPYSHARSQARGTWR